MIAFLLLFSAYVEAKTIFYGSVVERVPIKYGGPTIFRFPSPVQTITGAGRLEIVPANKADPSYTVLSVTPRFTNGANEVLFLLTDKSVVKTKILVSPSEGDSLYDFKPKNGEAETDGTSTISEIELLKAMYRDEALSGYKVSRVTQRITSRYANAHIQLLRVYRGNPFTGYVYRVRNTSKKKKLNIDARRITVGKPNMAILSQSDDPTLYPMGKGLSDTLVRVVAKNSASSGSVIFTMESEDLEKNP